MLLLVSIMTAGAQTKYIGVIRDTIYSPSQYMERVFEEYGNNLNLSDLGLAYKLADRIGRKSRFVAINYHTTDPKGRPVVASGVVAYPIEGKIKGVVEVAPVCKEKSVCGSVQMFATEFAPAVAGYITIMPDMIGYGQTAEMPISYFDQANSVIVSADMRKATEEFMKKELGMTIPKTSEIFGYSLGAANAFALACHYSARPWLGITVSSLFIGGGAYSPRIAFKKYKEIGKMDYVLFPGIVESVRFHRGVDIDITNIFKGKVLEDYNEIISAKLCGTDLAAIYGSDLHAYMKADFFSERGNKDINAVMNILNSEYMPKNGARLSPDIYVNIRHAKTDAIVPVECSDELVAQIEGKVKKLRYRRDKQGTHHSEAAKLFYDFIKYLII